MLKNNILEFKCDLCDYTTNIKFCYEKHSNTKKHLKKVEEQLKISEQLKQNTPKFICKFCDREFTKACNLSRHLGQCSEKEGLENKVELMEKEHLKEIEALKGKIRDMKIKEEMFLNIINNMNK